MTHHPGMVPQPPQTDEELMDEFWDDCTVLMAKMLKTSKITKDKDAFRLLRRSAKIFGLLIKAYEDTKKQKH